MSKLTILDMVQDILNDMDADEVNSISDTAEALQVAQILKTTFFEMISRKDWQHLRKFKALDAVADSARPTHLKLPVNVSRLDAFNYDVQKVTDTRNKYQEMIYQYPDEFVRQANELNSSDASVTTVTTFDGISLNVRNDRSPQYYTSFDDEYLVLDSHDSAVDSTLQSSKSQVLVYETPTWTATDGFTPDLPTEAFPALLAEAKSVASVKLNQEADQKAEQQSQRQQRMLAQRAWRTEGGIRYPNYGRRAGRLRDTRDSKLFGSRDG